MEIENEYEYEYEYALYSGDTFIACGTLKEISKETGLSIKQLRHYSFDSYIKKRPNGKRLIKLEADKLTKKQCERFAFMLKQKRLDNKLSRNELSERLGYTVSEIEKWENKRKQPNYYIVEDVATFFDIPLNVLIGEK